MPQQELASAAAVAPADGSNSPGSSSSNGGSSPDSDRQHTPSSATGSGHRKREQDITLPAGTRLGGFELRRVLGRGGMATVYKATQLSLNRPVAVKVLAARFAHNPVFVERFEREAGALANLNHPNIVNIIDKGVSEELYYFVMEMVEGITLDQLLSSVELTERHYVHIITEIAKALSYVHSKGIIHRDIKPSNVLVNRQGGVKVSDFGIAHITDAAMPPERFGRNASIGTAYYMSPEQATAPATVDQRSDVYSLAVTFYKMLTRQLPTGSYGMATAPTLLNQKLPRSVDAVLLRAMHPDREMRPANVTELCDALVQCFSPSMSNLPAALLAGTSVATGGGAAGSMLPPESPSQVFSGSGGLFPPAIGATTPAPDAVGSALARASALYVPADLVSPPPLVNDPNSSSAPGMAAAQPALVGAGAGAAVNAGETPRPGGISAPDFAANVLFGTAPSGTFGTSPGASTFTTGTGAAPSTSSYEKGSAKDPSSAEAGDEHSGRGKKILIGVVIAVIVLSGIVAYGYHWLYTSSYGTK